MGKYRGLDTEEGWIQRRLVAIERSIDELAAARRLVVASTWVQVDLNNINLTSSFQTYAVRTVTVPDGYTSAIVQLSVSAGSTISGDVGSTNNGNIGVQPVVTGFAGSALSQGKVGGGAMSINSTLATKIAVSGSFQVWATAYAAATGLVNNSGNVHLSATVLFVRD